jgi:SAM-dependent methyltransferase
MRTWALELLRCPKSGSILKLSNPKYQGKHIIKGNLISLEGRSYPIINGVPRLIIDIKNKRVKNTAVAFGNEWKIFNRSNGYMGSSDLFFDFVKGLSPSDFKGKVILDAGCGNGRWTKVVNRLGCKYIVAMDVSESVDFCFKNTRELDNVVVVQGSIYNPPFLNDCFDIVLSIGVLDHLPDPKSGLYSLKNVLKKGGKLSFWVYGLEGNELYLKIITPLRLISTRLPKKLLFIISCLFAGPIWIYAHIINEKFVLKRNGSERLPWANYFLFLRKFKYYDVINIIYDQLCPDLAHYIPRKELEKWIKELNLFVENFVFRNRNSYSILVRNNV